jgi:hypothetical protein
MIDMVEIEELRRYAFGQFLVNAAENHDRARFQKFCHHGTRQAAGLVLVVIVLIVERGKDWAVIGYHSGLR